MIYPCNSVKNPWLKEKKSDSIPVKEMRGSVGYSIHHGVTRINTEKIKLIKIIFSYPPQAV